MNEKLSAFVDNQLSELEERRLLAELERSDDLRARWGRYHMIRAALRREVEQFAPLNLRVAIAAALTAEANPNDRRKGDRRRFAFNVGKTVGGLAIAATVATIAILNLPATVTPEAAPATVAQTDATPAASATAPMLPAQAPHPLNAYLREHNEFAPTAGMGNMLPYVRTVNDDDNQSK